MKEASQNEFVEKSGVPHRVKSFREIDSSEDRPKVRPRLIKPTQNKLEKEPLLFVGKLVLKIMETTQNNMIFEYACWLALLMSLPSFYLFNFFSLNVEGIAL